MEIKEFREAVYALLSPDTPVSDLEFQERLEGYIESLTEYYGGNFRPYDPEEHENAYLDGGPNFWVTADLPKNYTSAHDIERRFIEFWYENHSYSYFAMSYYGCDLKGGFFEIGIDFDADDTPICDVIFPYFNGVIGSRIEDLLDRSMSVEERDEQTETLADLLGDFEPVQAIFDRFVSETDWDTPYVEDECSE